MNLAVSPYLRRQTRCPGAEGQTLRRLNDERLLDVEDISAFVAGQRLHLNIPDLNTPDRLWTPTETVFPAPDVVTPG